MVDFDNQAIKRDRGRQRWDLVNAKKLVEALFHHMVESEGRVSQLEKLMKDTSSSDIDPAFKLMTDSLIADSDKANNLVDELGLTIGRPNPMEPTVNNIHDSETEPAFNLNCDSFHVELMEFIKLAKPVSLMFKAMVDRLGPLADEVVNDNPGSETNSAFKLIRDRNATYTARQTFIRKSSLIDRRFPAYRLVRIGKRVSGRLATKELSHRTVPKKTKASAESGGVRSMQKRPAIGQSGMPVGENATSAEGDADDSNDDVEDKRED